MPFCRLNSARSRENETPLPRRSGPPEAIRSSAASPLMLKSRTLIRPSLARGSVVGGSIASASWPPTTLE